MELYLGKEVFVGARYGLGRITEIGPLARAGDSAQRAKPEWVGVRPYVAGYQMNFSPDNVTEPPHGST